MTITQTKVFIGKNHVKDYTQWLLDNIHNSINITWIDVSNDIITICYSRKTNLNRNYYEANRSIRSC